jgi:hypothetical protein
MNPLKFFRKSRSARNQPQAHMTWASTSMGRSLTRTGVFLKKQLWVWPIIAIVVLSIVGFAVRSAIESTMKANLRSGLGTLLEVERSMLETWLDTQAANAETLANDLKVREAVYNFLEKADDTPTEQVPRHEQLQVELAPAMSSHDYSGYFVADKSKQIVSSSQPALIGQREIDEYASFLGRALDGETVVCPPFSSVVMMRNAAGKVRTGEPAMYVCAPIRDVNFQVVAVLALQIRPEGEFTRILQLGRVGESGETYAFDKNGVMISNSRFDEDLILLGLIPDQEHSRSILNLLVRDPQGNMTEGYRPKQRRSEMPLTRMAADAIAGNADVDVEGYNDYRGVPVVGAWAWLPKYEIGVATEVDVAQAYRPLTILKRTFWALYGLLIVSSIAIFAFTVIVARLKREARKATIEARQLGQYTLDEKLGAGAMGVVYRGHHAMLRRPTAIKLIDADRVNDVSIQRFEREVQITCKLNNPNTIAIYDFGRTPEGIFYYAMEFLDGIDLQELVESNGSQPEGRVIHILLRMCGSLYEAHTHDLVHRDIKPANVMLNRRGGESDVVKVLDFGLVKALDDEKQAGASGNTLTGTPLYMSPEAIQTPMSVDARSDIYAVGAVGYFLLTGTPVFEAGSLVELCRKHVDDVPESPSKRLGKEVDSALEAALMACLEKSRAKRPQTARDLAQMLRKCPSANEWSLEEADAWWGRHERGQVDTNEPHAESSKDSAVFDQTIVTED